MPLRALILLLCNKYTKICNAPYTNTHRHIFKVTLLCSSGGSPGCTPLLQETHCPRFVWSPTAHDMLSMYPLARKYPGRCPHSLQRGSCMLPPHCHHIAGYWLCCSTWVWFGVPKGHCQWGQNASDGCCWSV